MNTRQTPQSISEPSTATSPERPTPEPKHRPLWKRVLRVLCVTVTAVIVIVLAAITLAVNYLHPKRLTPIVERLANDNLHADVKIGRIEISFWHTFPRFDLQVDSLTIVTHAFRGLPDSTLTALPAGADSLLSVRHFDAAINIPKLLVGKIALYDINLVTPRLNLVQATPEAWSLDIFPPSVKEEDKTDTPLSIPDISLGTFAITDGFPVSYRSLPDSIDVTVNLTTTRLDGDEAPVYRLDIDALTSATVKSLTIRRLQLGLDGDIDWSSRRPLHAGLSAIKARIGDVTMSVNAEMDFAEDFRLDALSLSLPLTRLQDIIALIPAEYRGDIESLRPEASLEMSMELTRPFAVGVDSMPSFNLRLKVPDASASYDGITLNSFTMSLTAEVDGLEPDRSVVSLDRLQAHGEGIGFSLSGNASTLFSDPQVSGEFSGTVNFARLPRSLMSMIPGKVSGTLDADCDFALRRSYLTREQFHRIHATGRVNLAGLDVDMPEFPITLYSRHAELRLGTNTSFVRDNHAADSLLTLSLKVDTLSALLQSIDVRVGALKAGVGSRNVSSSADTTRINPIGGRVEVGRLAFRDLTDSTRVYLRSATIGGALTRYKGNAREPLLNLNISSATTFYADSTMRAILRGVSSSLRVHPSDSPSQQRRRARTDSLRRLYPNLSRDSIATLAASISRAERMARRASGAPSGSKAFTTDSRVNVDADASLKKILRRWKATGSLQASRVRLFTPLFPLRNSVNGLDMSFTTDSIAIRNTSVRLGRSDLKIDGTVSNIARALTSRRNSQSLIARFNVQADTIDINEIAAATFAGAAWADSHTKAVYLDDAGLNENSLQTQVAAAAADTASVLIIPANIEAELDVRASHILYSNLAFHDFRGTLNAFDGALNLSQLSAQSSVGALSLNALYTAPTKQEASFAFDLDVNRLRIGQFLDLLPAIDSIMPALSSIDGVINATVAATSQLDSMMNLEIPSLKAAVKISGDSLVMMDDETFRKIGRWLLFKDKKRNLIDSMTVEMLVDNSQMQMFPFIFNIDRYKLGVEGTNDLAMNLNYHIAVLKSPIPFKFGINITGNADKMKIRLGRARFSEKNMPRTFAIADTTRINLVREIRNAFRRGVTKSNVRASDFITTPHIDTHSRGGSIASDVSGDTISRADSLYFIQQGLLPAPPAPEPTPEPVNKKKKKK